MIETKHSRRAGLLATQGIRGGENNRVLQRIKKAGDIFFGVSDQEWILDGAAVHVSMVGFDDGSQHERQLDGKPVLAITPELTGGLSLVDARALPENQGIGFIGDVKGGPFDVPGDVARAWVAAANPDGRSNASVVRPWLNGFDVSGRPQDFWIVDFGCSMTLSEAALYELPFAYVERHVKGMRAEGRPSRDEWWLHMRPGPGMRAAVAGLRRYPTTTLHSKYRIFIWLDGTAIPSHALAVFARDDDYFFGVIQSTIHDVWSRKKGTQLREAESGCRYTPTTCFETFPFPPLSGGIKGDGTWGKPMRDRISKAAARLVNLRDGWLNPCKPDGAPALDGRDLATRTITNLYRAYA